MNFLRLSTRAPRTARLSFAVLGGIGVLGCSFLAGCGSKSLVGSWKFKDVTLSADAKKMGATDALVKQQMGTSTIDFKDGKTFTLGGPQSVAGSYTLDGNAITLQAETVNGQSISDQIAKAKQQFKNNPAILKKIDAQKPGLMKGTLSQDGKEVDLDSNGTTIKFEKAS